MTCSGLERFLEMNPRMALAFSGGADSAYLLYCALKHCDDVRAYFVKTRFQPSFELRCAEELAASLGADLTIVHTDIMRDTGITCNTEDRCYRCKLAMFSKLSEVSRHDGYRILADGTNASDIESERPGMRALKELSVISPLRDLGMSKDRIRELSRLAGLPTWNKPSYSCLATRIPSGRAITCEDLELIEESESIVRDMGFSDFRVRLNGKGAVLRFGKGEIDRALKMSSEIITNISEYYDTVAIDPDPR